jgi:hypothetical protein
MEIAVVVVGLAIVAVAGGYALRQRSTASGSSTPARAPAASPPLPEAPATPSHWDEVARSTLPLALRADPVARRAEPGGSNARRRRTVFMPVVLPEAEAWSPDVDEVIAAHHEALVTGVEPVITDLDEEPIAAAADDPVDPAGVTPEQVTDAAAELRAHFATLRTELGRNPAVH